MICRKKLNFKSLKKDKKGQLGSALLAVISVFIVGIILFFLNHMSNELYSSFDQYFNDSEDFNNSEAHQAVQRINKIDNSVWDYAFLAIYIGLMINLILFSFGTRINIAFYWLFAIVGIIILIVGTMLSSIWQEMASEEVFAETIARFPITDILLGTYFPIAVTAMLMIFMIVLFGKPPGQQTI